MPIPPAQTIYYKRARFTSRLPKGYRYAASHYWLCEAAPGLWRVGMTRFATRMLGDLVEHEFSCSPGQEVEPGETIGWVEGFKALTDVYSAMRGEFAGGNPALAEDPALLDNDPYDKGWLYAVRGEPEHDSLDVHGYISLLDTTIDRMLAQSKEQMEDENCPKPGTS